MSFEIRKDGVYKIIDRPAVSDDSEFGRFLRDNGAKDYIEFKITIGGTIRAVLKDESTRPTPPSTRIVRAPGAKAQALLEVVYSRRTFEGIFSQALFDMREEHAEALFRNRPGHARWIHARGILTLGFTIAAHSLATFGKTAVKIWKMSP